MKNLVGATLMTAGLLLTVVGCNDAKDTNNSKEVSSEAAAIEQEETANIEDEYGPAENFLTPDEEKEGFEYVEGLGGVKPYGFGYNEQVGIDGTDAPLKPIVIGPAKFTIKNVRVVDIIPSDDSADMLEAETGGRVRSIVLDVESENTSDADISFYPDQMTLTTDSGEQIDADIFLSDDVGGDFIGKVKKEGSIRFLTKNPEQDIKNITLVIDPPSSPETYENIGEQVRLDFEILDVDSSLKRDGKK